MPDDKLITLYQLTAPLIATRTKELMAVLDTLTTTDDHETAKEIYPIITTMLEQLRDTYFKAMDIEYSLRWVAKVPKKTVTKAPTLQDKTVSVVDRWLSTLSPEQKEALKHLEKT